MGAIERSHTISQSSVRHLRRIVRYLWALRIIVDAKNPSRTRPRGIRSINASAQSYGEAFEPRTSMLVSPWKTMSTATKSDSFTPSEPYLTRVEQTDEDEVTCISSAKQDLVDTEPTSD